VGKGKKAKKAAEEPQEGGKETSCATKVPKGGWTNKLARERAKALGYEEKADAPFNAHGQLTFKSGNRWITPDVDGHTGVQSWKLFDSSGNRLGTYNTDLTVLLGP